MESQKILLNEKTIDGILFIKDIDNVELTVNNEPAWLSDIQKALNSACQQIKLEQANISPEQFRDIFKQTEMKIIYNGDIKEKSSLGEKITAGIFMMMMLMGIVLGITYQFTAITGEKQLRITEIIVSAISSQTLIDGKILGLSLLSLALLVTYSLSSVVFVFISSIFGSGWAFPIVLTNPALIFLLFLFSINGFFLWNTFFSAISATINDPNTSTRGPMIMLPIIPVVFAFFVFKYPDSLAIKILSVFPLTSAPVISARLVLTQVPFIEIVLSLILLVLSTWYLRKAAGKIFSVSILMYGKEPSWKEIFRWFKESMK
ncbi:MAG: ABC transporter permease [Candidatus Cloacimonetes bacterium]|nr:ABC transporter permease [Candidatus Cloacimonadota bacterium]